MNFDPLVCVAVGVTVIFIIAVGVILVVAVVVFVGAAHASHGSVAIPFSLWCTDCARNYYYCLCATTTGAVPSRSRNGTAVVRRTPSSPFVAIKASTSVPVVLQPLVAEVVGPDVDNSGAGAEISPTQHVGPTELVEHGTQLACDGDEEARRVREPLADCHGKEKSLVGIGGEVGVGQLSLAEVGWLSADASEILVHQTLTVWVNMNAIGWECSTAEELR